MTPGGDRVEMALDRGTATAGSRRADIREVEFELLSGDRRALFEVARPALAGVAFHFSTEAKSDLGYALLEGEIGAALPTTAIDAKLDDDMSVEMALQLVLRSCASQISANVAAIRVDDDPEGAHQLRVGLRRQGRDGSSHHSESAGSPAGSAEGDPSGDGTCSGCGGVVVIVRSLPGRPGKDHDSVSVSCDPSVRRNGGKPCARMPLGRVVVAEFPLRIVGHVPAHGKDVWHGHS